MYVQYGCLYLILTRYKFTMEGGKGGDDVYHMWLWYCSCYPPSPALVRPCAGSSTVADLSNTGGVLPSSRNYTGLLISHLAVRVSAGRITTAILVSATQAGANPHHRNYSGFC
jgi:hypothetical protein